MTTTAELQELLQEIDRTPWGPVEREMTARAVAAAVELGDEELEYQARMRQSGSANQGGDTDLLLSSFAWCLAKHDSDPVRFPADINNGSADLMWHFKWMASTLRASPEFSTEQIAAVLDDMQAHYVKAGLGESGVAMARFEDAWVSGRLDEAEDLRVKLEAIPRDSHSHCDACGRSQLVGYFADIGRDDDAIRLVEEMVEGGFACGEEPEHALARSLLPYLRTGRNDDAKRAHMRSYRLARDNADNLSMVAMNIIFATITGNEARALAMVERHIPWLNHDNLNGAAHARALRAFALALDGVSSAGHPDATVRGADAENLVRFFGEHDGPWNAKDLAAASWAAAERIGAQFDERNGTAAFHDQLAHDRALAGVRVSVPISSDAFVTEQQSTAPQTAEERYRRAIDLSDWGDADASIPALQASLADNDPAHVGDLHGLLIGALLAGGRENDAVGHLQPYSDARRAEGRTEFADVVDELGLTLFGLGGTDAIARLQEMSERTETADARGLVLSGLAHALLQNGAFAEGLEAAKASHAAFIKAGDPEDIVDSLSSVAFFAGLVGDGELARTSADEALTSPVLSSGQRANLLETRARSLGGAEEYAQGAADADEASQIIATLGATRGAARLSVLAGALLEDADQPGEAAARYRVAIRQLEREGEDTAATRFRLARALLAMGAASEAVELLNSVYADESAAEVDAGSRAQTVELLAQAFEVDDQPGNAVGAWGHTAELYEEAENAAGQAHALMTQGRILGQFGEHEDAIGILEEAVELAKTDPENVGLIVRGIHLLGQAFAGMKDERAWAAFDETEQLARENNASWLIADVTDSRARAYAVLGDVDQAIGHSLQAADGYAAEGDIMSAAGSELFAGRTLASVDRAEDAVSIYQSLLARPVADSPLQQVAALELGDLLAALGRHGDAAAVRALIQG